MSSPATRARRPSTASRAWSVQSEYDLRVGGLWAVTFGPSRDELYRHDRIFGVMDRPSHLVVDTTESYGRPVQVQGVGRGLRRRSVGGPFALESVQKSEALLLGRVTHEAMQAFWPTAEGELADRLNKLPKYVASSTLTDPPWSATVLGDDWPEEVAMSLEWQTGERTLGISLGGVAPGRRRQ